MISHSTDYKQDFLRIMNRNIVQEMFYIGLIQLEFQRTSTSCKQYTYTLYG